MRFCPKCGKILIPKNNRLICNCGYEDEISDEDIKEEYQFEGEKVKENLAVYIQAAVQRTPSLDRPHSQARHGIWRHWGY